MGTAINVIEPPLITIQSNSRPVFTMKIEDGKLVSVIAEYSNFDEVSEKFFEALTIKGLTLYEKATKAQGFIDQVYSLAGSNPNDMEFGRLVRQMLTT